jgi:hypothetical protein
MIVHISRYLFASQDTTRELELLARQKGSRGLLELFPNLVIAVERMSPIQETSRCQRDDPNAPNLIRRRCCARIFQPIKPGDFVKGIVMGAERHLTEFEEGCEYLRRNRKSINHISAAARQKWVNRQFGQVTRRYTGSIHTIQFEPEGYFRAEKPEEGYYFSATPSGRDFSAAELEYFEEHDTDVAECMVYFTGATTAGSAKDAERTTRLVSSVKGILSLFPPWGGKGGWLTLPRVHFDGRDLPVGEIMHEVGLITILRSRYSSSLR